MSLEKLVISKKQFGGLSYWFAETDFDRIPCDAAARAVCGLLGVEVERPRTDAERIAGFVAAVRTRGPDAGPYWLYDAIRDEFGVEI